MLLFELRVLRAGCFRKDVYVFATEEEARRAEAFCKDKLKGHVKEVSVEVVGPGAVPNVTTYKAFKADILELEDIERDPDPDFADAQTFLDAASQHGDDEGNDVEISDLQDYFQAAFELLTPEQKAAFLKDPRVHDCLVASLVIEEPEEEEA